MLVGFGWDGSAPPQNCCSGLTPGELSPDRKLTGSRRFLYGWRGLRAAAAGQTGLDRVLPGSNWLCSDSALLCKHRGASLLQPASRWCSRSGWWVIRLQSLCSCWVWVHLCTGGPTQSWWTYPKLQAERKCVSAAQSEDLC